jgi:hypothetical protein
LEMAKRTIISMAPIHIATTYKLLHPRIKVDIRAQAIADGKYPKGWFGAI